MYNRSRSRGGVPRLAGGDIAWEELAPALNLPFFHPFLLKNPMAEWLGFAAGRLEFLGRLQGSKGG